MIIVIITEAEINVTLNVYMLCCALFGLFIFHNTCVLFLSILDTAGADDEHTSSVRRHAQSAVMQPLKVLPAFLC